MTTNMNLNDILEQFSVLRRAGGSAAEWTACAKALRAAAFQATDLAERADVYAQQVTDGYRWAGGNHGSK